jgi:hypothetical protein
MHAALDELLALLSSSVVVATDGQYVGEASFLGKKII